MDSINKPATPVLAFKDLCKSFTGVRALHQVSFNLVAGEVHALLGENGAGKSTLVKVATGVHAPDGGSIHLRGAEISPQSPAAAQALGISTVYQEVNLLPNLSVAHNLYLGREPIRLGCIDWKKIHAAARALLARFNLDIDVTSSLGNFSTAIQQLVAIARAVDCSAQVLILDEPTASLDADETALLFQILKDLKARGIAMLFITHFLDQVYAIADRITVLRNGQHVGTYVTAELSRPALVAHMLGKELQELSQHHTSAHTGSNVMPALSVTTLGAANGIHNISFSVARGEALGLAGLLGSGRTELCQTLFGLVRQTAGSIRINGKELHLRSPAAAVKQGFALCPEDRKTQGIIGPLSIRENLLLALQAKRGWYRPLSLSEQNKFVEQAINNFAIVTTDDRKAVAELSGGNQQKVILARWLATTPLILLLDEPTRGIDIGAHAEIIKLIRRLREQGLVLLVASSEIEELVAFSDKVIVLHERTKVAELSGAQLTEPQILAAVAQAS